MLPDRCHSRWQPPLLLNHSRPINIIIREESANVGISVDLARRSGK